MIRVQSGRLWPSVAAHPTETFDLGLQLRNPLITDFYRGVHISGFKPLRDVLGAIHVPGRDGE